MREVSNVPLFRRTKDIFAEREKKAKLEALIGNLKESLAKLG